MFPKLFFSVIRKISAIWNRGIVKNRTSRRFRENSLLFVVFRQNSSVLGRFWICILSSFHSNLKMFHAFEIFKFQYWKTFVNLANFVWVRWFSWVFENFRKYSIIFGFLYQISFLFPSTFEKWNIGQFESFVKHRRFLWFFDTIRWHSVIFGFVYSATFIKLSKSFIHSEI